MKKTPVKNSVKVEISPKEYAKTLADLKKDIQETQLKANLLVNRELIRLYWKIGQRIVEKQKNAGWGSNIIEKLAKDLQNSFPEIEGFSRSNIFYMRSFYLAYEKVQKLVGQFDALPKELKSSLPTIKEIEAELKNEENS